MLNCRLEAKVGRGVEHPNEVPDPLPDNDLRPTDLRSIHSRKLVLGEVDTATGRMPCVDPGRVSSQLLLLRA
jgi:hypothetical protein